MLSTNSRDLRRIGSCPVWVMSGHNTNRPNAVPVCYELKEAANYGGLTQIVGANSSEIKSVAWTVIPVPAGGVSGNPAAASTVVAARRYGLIGIVVSIIIVVCNVAIISVVRP